MGQLLLLRQGSGNIFSMTDKAILHIIAPTGSYITLLKDNQTKATFAPKDGHTDAYDAGHDIWYYVIASNDFGTWTVGVEYEGEQAFSDVSIIKARTYEVQPFNELPEFSYTGTCSLIKDGVNNENWRIKFLSSGTLTFTKLNSARYVDIFCVGGGGGGIWGGAGGGGYTTTTRGVPLQTGVQYTITIGAGSTGNGGSSSFANLCAANGGYKANNDYGGNGGSGGATWSNNNGGTNGGNGGGTNGGQGQGTTTREFGELSGDLYAGGGGTATGVGGTGGGGGGGKPGATNTGGGGGSGLGSGQTFSGGSGIVVIRNARPV